jgi:2-keto-4-pentenoate hydratase/2-oxohepta-3-ene-1,7-dioic acid hydratase in catechol pathway
VVLLVYKGYIVGIDMTARNVQDAAKRAGLPWTIAKGFDTFLPISELIPKSAIPDPHDAHLHLRVDNELRQSDNTELMLYRIPRQLAEISRVMTLEPGDIVLTGTPKGVGEVKGGQTMRAGVKVGGKEIVAGNIDVAVEDGKGPYEFVEDAKL